MKSLLALLLIAFVLLLGSKGYAQHSRRARSQKPLKKRRARVRAREPQPRSLATDEDDELVLAPRAPSSPLASA